MENILFFLELENLKHTYSFLSILIELIYKWVLHNLLQQARAIVVILLFSLRRMKTGGFVLSISTIIFVSSALPRLKVWLLCTAHN